MAFADTQKLVVELDLKGNLTSKLGDAARAVQGFDRATGNTQRSLGKFSQNIQRGIVVGAAAVAGALGAVVKTAADYESAFAGVRKTVNATEPELQALSKAFRDMSKEIPISASELARLGEAGGALGVPTAQLKEFVRVTALLGVTTNLSADEAANSLGILGNVLHLTGAEYSKFASSLVALGNAGASTESDIISIAERIGATAHLIGISTQEVLGFSSAVASLGIESEAGGTALQKFFIDSAKFVAAGGKDLKEFAKVAGTSAKSFKKAFAEDAAGALEDFLAGLGKLPQAKQLKILEDFGFNDARITRTLLGLANNTKLVSDQMGVANKAFAENTALTKEAEQRFNTFDSQLAITKNTLTDMAITIGSKLLPKITPLLKQLNEFVGAHAADIEKFGTDLAAGFERFANALQKVDWKPFIDGLKLSASIAQTAVKLFMSLPKELQAGLIGGFAVNKLTGGLPTSIVKDVGGALLKRLADRGSSPGNPMWVKDISAGAGGAAVAGSKLGGVASAIGKVFLVGAAIGVFAELKGILDDQSKNNAVQTAAIKDQTAAFTGGATLADLQNSLAGIEAIQKDMETGLTPEKIAYSMNIDGVRTTVEQTAADLRAAIAKASEKQAEATRAGAFGFGKKITEAASSVKASYEAAALAAAARIRAAVHEQTRFTHQQLLAIRNNRIDKSDIAAIPKLLDFYKSSLHPSQKSIQNDIKALKSIQAHYAAIGDTKTAAKVGKDIRTLQGILNAAITRASARATATTDRTSRVQVGAMAKAAAQIRAAEERTRAAARQTTEAVKDKDLSVSVTANSYVTVNDILHKNQTKIAIGQATPA